MGGVFYVTVFFDRPMDESITPASNDFYLTYGGMEHFDLLAGGAWLNPTSYRCNTAGGMVAGPSYKLYYYTTGQRLRSRKFVDLADFSLVEP